MIDFEIKLIVSSSDVVQLENMIASPDRFFMCNRPNLTTQFESENLDILSKINPLQKIGKIKVL